MSGNNKRKQTRGESPINARRVRGSTDGSDQTVSSIDRLTEVMADFLERSNNRPTAFATKEEVVPPFNPEDRDQSAEAWCRKVDELRGIFRWTEDATIYYALAKLRGLAEVWYKGLPSVNMSWAEWKEKLRTAFPSTRDFNDDLSRMMQRQKRRDESYARYFYEKLSLINACRIIGTDAVSCLIGGIDDVVVKTGARAGNHQTPESLFAYLATISDTKALPKPATATTSSFSRASQVAKTHHRGRQFDEKRPSVPVCYDCGKEGHYRRQCRKPAPENSRKSELRCNYCRGTGHTEKYCNKKNKDPKTVA